MSAIEKKQRFNFVRPQFIERMEAELLSNSAHKGDWISWLPDKLLLVAELNWHLAKLVQAIMDNDSSKVSEYAADIANYGMKADEIYGNQTEETMLKNLAPTVWERVGLVSDSKDCGGSNIAPSEEVLKRYNAIKNLVESETRTAAMVKNAADSHGVHSGTIYRWLNLYEQNGRIADLDPKKASGGRGKSRLANEIDAVISAAVIKFYKKDKNAGAVIEEVKRQCVSRSLKAPHNNTIRNRIDVLTGRRKKKRKKRGKIDQFQSGNRRPEA